MQDGDQRVVFTGDTLFIGGMSRLILSKALRVWVTIEYCELTI